MTAGPPARGLCALGCQYSIPRGVHVNVQEGDRVRAGDPLMDGPSNPHDILHVLGEKELQKYLVNEIQEVYRLQGVNINDKHIEVITRQMMRWVRVEDVGDTEFLVDEQVDKFRFMEENERVIGNGGHPAKAQPLLHAPACAWSPPWAGSWAHASASPSLPRVPVPQPFIDL